MRQYLGTRDIALPSLPDEHQTRAYHHPRGHGVAHADGSGARALDEQERQRAQPCIAWVEYICQTTLIFSTIAVLSTANPGATQ